MSFMVRMSTWYSLLKPMCSSHKWCHVWIPHDALEVLNPSYAGEMPINPVSPFQIWNLWQLEVKLLPKGLKLNFMLKVTEKGRAFFFLSKFHFCSARSQVSSGPSFIGRSDCVYVSNQISLFNCFSARVIGPMHPSPKGVRAYFCFVM